MGMVRNLHEFFVSVRLHFSFILKELFTNIFIDIEKFSNVTIQYN